MAFTLEIETDNAAFDNVGVELARILRDLAVALEATYVADGTDGTVRDINGNTVGHFTLDPREDTPTK